MSICFAGQGNAGSWKIRGEQLGQAVGADVIQNATLRDIEKYETAVIVKKNVPGIEAYTGKRIFDAIDCWKQPQGNRLNRKELIEHVKEKIGRVNPHYVIAATEQMRIDLGADFTLYHHHRPGLEKQPVSERIYTVGYEGCGKYLGKWLRPLGQLCQQIGASFVVNPPTIQDLDLIVALRDYPYKGYGPDNWKSNVKLANAQGAGIPIICAREKGYEETDNGAALWADTPDELADAFDFLYPQARRLEVSQKLYDARYTVEDAANDFKDAFEVLGL